MTKKVGNSAYLHTDKNDLCSLNVISRFGFKGWIWVLIASVPDLCVCSLLSILQLQSGYCRLKEYLNKVGIADVEL